MAQSRFENRSRGWEDDDRSGSDRFREERDFRGRDRDQGRFGGGGGWSGRRDDRDRARDHRDRFEGGRSFDRGQQDYGDLDAGFDRWGDGESGGRRMQGGMGSGGSAFGRGGFGGGRDRDHDERGRDFGYGRSGEEWAAGPHMDNRYGNHGYGFGDDNRGQRGWGGQGGYGGRSDDRGFFDRAADEVRSWMGDDDAARRREADHRGKGPRGYQRSDERIRDDLNDRLSDDWRLDASDIEVSVTGGEVTLTGVVSSKMDKRRAEDCADSVSGVRHVQNNLRVRDSSMSGQSDYGSSQHGATDKSSGPIAGPSAGTGGRSTTGSGETEA